MRFDLHLARLLPTLVPALIVGLCVFAAPASAQEFSSLEERMSHSEFTAAGLDKLSPEELAALNAWLRNSVEAATSSAAEAAAAAVAASAPPARAERVGFERAGVLGSSDAPSETSGRIKGTFRGWDKKGQRFELDNGQIWEVTQLDAPLLGVRLEEPLAFIEAGFSGAWYLRVEGYNSRVKVKRVK